MMSSIVDLLYLNKTLKQVARRSHEIHMEGFLRENLWKAALVLRNWKTVCLRGIVRESNFKKAASSQRNEIRKFARRV